LIAWFFLNHGVCIEFELLIDSLPYSFMLLTTTIGLFVYAYAFSYFRYEPLVDRFLLFLCSFILSMLLLVSSGNLIVLFLGWELIGLTSFFLINFWVTRIGTLKAAFKAFSFNKVSDYFMLVLLFVIYDLLYDLDIVSINSQIHLFHNYSVKIIRYDINLLEVVSFCILGAAFNK
jgi:NADH:ubiquinone oxidoreductase subunit 5 (subunit L)/multisubunit Na+/H+ antiporter MnhA subunit